MFFKNLVCCSQFYLNKELQRSMKKILNIDGVTIGVVFVALILLFMITAPPMDPGMQEKNSILAILLSLAKFATLRSSVAAPASTISSSISFV